MTNLKKTKGFTLIELLLVIAIIAILAAVIFVMLDPLKRFRDSRDSVRREDVYTISQAIKLYQIDNGGIYHKNITDLMTERVYMISGDGASSGCDDYNQYCLTNVPYDHYCVDLEFLKSNGYLGAIPVSPSGETSWSESITGYTLEISTTSAITIRACEAENTNEIFAIW